MIDAKRQLKLKKSIFNSTRDLIRHEDKIQLAEHSQANASTVNQELARIEVPHQDLNQDSNLSMNGSSKLKGNKTHGQFEGSGKNRKVYIAGLGIVQNFMASDDLNVCVEALLHKRTKCTPSDLPIMNNRAPLCEHLPPKEQIYN